MAALVKSVMASSPIESLKSVELPLLESAVSTAVAAKASAVAHRLGFSMWRRRDWEDTFSLRSRPKVDTGLMAVNKGAEHEWEWTALPCGKSVIVIWPATLRRGGFSLRTLGSCHLARHHEGGGVSLRRRIVSEALLPYQYQKL